MKKLQLSLISLLLAFLVSCDDAENSGISKDLSDSTDIISTKYPTKEYETISTSAAITSASVQTTSSLSAVVTTTAEETHQLQEIDMSQYSKNAVILTEQDIPIYNDYEYFDTAKTNWIVYNDEQLDFLPAEFHRFLSDEALENYPLGEYAYVIEQENVSCGGYHLKAGGLLIDDVKMFFVLTDDSYTPDERDQPQVLCGFGHFAAVPVEYLDSSNDYNGWIVPNPNDYTQSNNYFCGLQLNYDKSLIEKLPKRNYIIENQEELERFAELSDDKERVMYSLKRNDVMPSFEESVLYVSIFERETDGFVRDLSCDISADGNVEINMYLTDGGSDISECGIAFAYIPKEFLNENSFNWSKP